MNNRPIESDISMYIIMYIIYIYIYLFNTPMS